MSFELIAILTVGVVMGLETLTGILIAVHTFGAMERNFQQTWQQMERNFQQGKEATERHFQEMQEQMDRGFQEMQRITRAVAALVVQESEKIQALFHS